MVLLNAFTTIQCTDANINGLHTVHKDILRSECIASQLCLVIIWVKWS
jgi:hypothetical protein